jgi:hypothetical protein
VATSEKGLGPDHNYRMIPVSPASIDEQSAVNTIYLRRQPTLRTIQRLIITSLIVLAACFSQGRLAADDSDLRYDWFSNEAGDQWGLKDTKTGTVVFAPRFNGGTGHHEGERLGTDLQDGKAWVYEGDKVELIDVKGEVLARFSGFGLWPWHGDLFILAAQTGYGIVSNTGKEILPATCYQISEFSDGMAILGTWDSKTPSKPPVFGYIDGNGAVIIQPQFNGANPFSEGLALVCRDGPGSLSTRRATGLLFLPRLWHIRSPRVFLLRTSRRRVGDSSTGPGNSSSGLSTRTCTPTSGRAGHGLEYPATAGGSLPRAG